MDTRSEAHNNVADRGRLPETGTEITFRAPEVDTPDDVSGEGEPPGRLVVIETPASVAIT